MKDHMMAPENGNMSPVSEKRKKSANMKNFLVDNGVGEAIFPVQKPYLNF